MTRATIYPPPTAPQRAPGTWAALVAGAVDSDEQEQLLSLLGGADSKRRMLEGFTLDSKGSNVPFSQLCLHHGRAVLLRAVVSAAPSGITLHDCCRTNTVEARSGLTVISYSSLLEDAVNMANPAALALALELLPNQPTLELKRFDGRSLHYEALYRTTMSNTLARCQNMADCCRLLISAGAPIASANLGVSGPVDMLFRYRWQMDGVQSVVVPLIGDYLRAGLIDLDAVEPSGQYPAGIAALAGNGYAAAAAVDLGCRLDLAPAGTGHGDIISVAQACLVSHCVTETVALVTASVMRRKIASSSPATDCPSIQPGRGARRLSV